MNTPQPTVIDNALYNKIWTQAWILGIPICYIFRVEIVRFCLGLARRALPQAKIWLKEFENQLLHPLSWVLFILLSWLAINLTDITAKLSNSADVIRIIVMITLASPLIWCIICLGNYATWAIIRMKGWKRTASQDEDDYNRVMILTEGISVVKIILILLVISNFIIRPIGQITKFFDTVQITNVSYAMLAFVFVFGSHTWLKNIIGGLIVLTDEEIKSGTQLQYNQHQGVVETLYLQCLAVRRYDKGLAYIPNGSLTESTIKVQNKTLDHQITVPIYLDPNKTTATSLRLFVHELDALMAHKREVPHKTDGRNEKMDNILDQHHTQLNGKSKASPIMKNVGQSSSVNQKTLQDFIDVYNNLSQKNFSSRNQDKIPESKQIGYWVSVESPFVVHVVYYTRTDRRLKSLLKEKTEVIFDILSLIERMKLKTLSDIGGDNSVGLTKTFLRSQDQSGEVCGPSPLSNTSPWPLRKVNSDRGLRRRRPASAMAL